MNSQNFPIYNLEKNSDKIFHSTKLELRDSNGEKVGFNSVGVTRDVLIIRRASENFFLIKVYKK